MSANRQAVPLSSSEQQPSRQVLPSLLGSVVWTLFAVMYLKIALHEGTLLDVGLFSFYLTVAFLMLARRAARRTGVWWEQVLGWGSAILPMAAYRPALGGLIIPALIVQGLGMAGLLASVWSLGRSFGIAPADRGLVTRGAYRIIRHPMYAAEMVFNVGFLLANPSWRNGGALLVIAVTQIARILREERVLAEYAAYARQVRWRLIPWVW